MVKGLLAEVMGGAVGTAVGARSSSTRYAMLEPVANAKDDKKEEEGG
jgi:hypothetical protein